MKCLELTNLKRFRGRENMVLEKECRLAQVGQCSQEEDRKVEKNSQDKKFKLLSVKLRRDFRRIYARGQKKYTASLVIYTLFNREKKTRVGISVSKKIGCAVKRNRARRIIRETFRNLRLDIGRDIIAVAKPVIAGKRMQDIYKELLNFFKNKNNYSCNNYSGSKRYAY